MLDKETINDTEPEVADDEAQGAKEAAVSEPDSSAGGTTDPPDVESQSVDLEAEVQTLRDKVLRQAAEFQNYRRRMEKANLEAISIGKSIVVQRLLDVLDDLERSLTAAKSDDVGSGTEALREGVQLVFQKFSDELARLGVVPIEAEGVAFNEDEHEAMMQQPAPDGVEPGTVLQELQKGYRMGDRILRHSKVVVAS